MKELQECLNAKRKIDTIDEKIYELRARVFSPKNQIISDMPRSKGGVDNAIEKYIIKLERLQQQKDDMLKYQAQQWQIVQEKTPNIKEQEKQLLYIRFVKGFAWNKCVVELNRQYGNWNVNKAFRIYRKINKIA